MPAMDVTDIDKDYEESEAAEFGTVPDGPYRTVIAAVAFKWSKGDDPKRQCTWRHKIIEGAERGSNLFKNYSLERKHLKWLKGDCKRCGVEFKNLSEMQNRSDKLLGIECDVLARTEQDQQGRNWQRVYLQKAYPNGAPSNPAKPPEDDAPF